MTSTHQLLVGMFALSSMAGGGDGCRMCKPDPPPPAPPVVYGCDSGYVCDMNVPNVVRVQAQVTASSSVRFEASGAVISVRSNGAEIAAALDAVTANVPAGISSIELLVRNASDSPLTTTLKQDGTALGGAFALGAWQPVTWALDGQLEAVRLPNGAGPVLALFIMQDDGVGIDKVIEGGGTAGGAFLASPPKATKTLALGVFTGSQGRARLVHNDKGSDGDKDGLGARLEATLGTCDSRNGSATGPDGVVFSCSLAADAKDTDGDGLSDGVELLGRRDVTPHQPLALWGANVRHKDMFVEIDFQLRAPGEAAKKMKPEVARKFAAYYGNQVGLPSQDATRRAANGKALNNPDGLPGISVHQDTGVAPERAEDATIYGDWGGYTAVAPVSDGNGGVMGKPVGQAWKEDMAPARRGLFRYSLPYASGGGSTGVGISWQFGIDDAWGLAHESGHANGLSHGGPGGVGTADPNCKPNYQSMMNYAYQSVPQSIGFSDGFGATSLDDWSLVEQQAVDPEEDFYLDLLESTYRYNVDRASGHVDWNRDGLFSATPVRAYANYKPGGGGCEWTRCNGHAPTSDKTIVPPAIGRVGNRLYVFYSAGAQVKFRSSTNAFDCPQPSATCGSWDESSSFSGDASGGLDAARVNDLLYVVYRSADGTLNLRTISASRAISAPVTIATGVGGQPALASHGCELSLAYKVGTAVKLRRMACSTSSFGAEENVASVIGNQSSPALVYAYLPPFENDARLYAWLTNANHENELWRYDAASTFTKVALFDGYTRSYGRPGLVWVPRSNDERDGKLYAAYPQAVADEQVRIIEWQQSYVKRDPATGTLTTKIGLTGPYDNVWAYGRGFDFWFDYGVDTNVRGVANWIRPEGSPADDSVWFLPKADAVNQYVMENYDDWPQLAAGICKGVVNPGNTVSEPIKCADWPKY